MLKSVAAYEFYKRQYTLIEPEKVAELLLLDPRLLELWVDALRACPDAAFVFNAYNRLGADGRIEDWRGARHLYPE